MEAYRTATPESNTFPVLVYARPRWTLEQRKPRLRKLHGAPTRGRGVRRRDSAEFRIDNALTWLRALATGAEHVRDSRGKPMPVAPALYQQLGRVTPGLWDMRGKLRAGVDWLVRNGPASGWALRNEGLPQGETKPLTSYYVPMRSRAAAEKWLRFARNLARLVALFSALLSKVRPGLRSATTEPTPEKKQDSVPGRSGETRTGCRSHVSPEGAGPPRSLREVLDDVERKYGDGGDDERRG